MTRVWIGTADAEGLLDAVGVEGELETGGILLGYRADGGGDVVITHLVGAGPGAQRRRDGFAPDHSYQNAEIERIFTESGGRSVYLGDWHTHPGEAPSPSLKDKAVLRRIAAHRPAAAVRPIMLIGGVDDDRRLLAAWVGHRKWLRFDVSQAQLLTHGT